MYSIPLAYFLWLISGFGALGFHRFYMGKFFTGVLWAFTGGLGMFGAIYDFFTLPRQVEEANVRRRAEELLAQEMRGRIYGQGGGTGAYGSAGNAYGTAGAAPRPEPVFNSRGGESRHSVEHSILRLARLNRGLASPAEVALDADISLDKAKEALEKLAAQDHCEMRVKKTGAVTFFFPEFADQYTEDELEGF